MTKKMYVKIIIKESTATLLYYIYSEVDHSLGCRAGHVFEKRSLSSAQ